MSFLEIHSLRKSYGTHLAVAELSFSVEQGEVFGLLGPNGAGKSTTMMMLAGHLLPDAGTIRLGGETYNPRNPQHRRKLGVVPQDLAIYPDLTAAENLQFFGGIYGLQRAELQARVADVLSRVGLTHNADEQVQTFSGGMKRRLNFGVALLHEPQLLILDEPTVGVDPQSRSHMLETVREVSRAGVSIIYASHYMEEVQSLCQRVAIIDHGTLLACDTVSRLLGQMSCDLFLRVRGTPKLRGLMADLAEVRESTDGDMLLVLTADGQGQQHPLSHRLHQTVDRLLQSGIELKSVETHESNLERLFLELTGRTLRD